MSADAKLTNSIKSERTELGVSTAAPVFRKARFELKSEVTVHRIDRIPIPSHLNSDSFAGRIMDALSRETKNANATLIRAVIDPGDPGYVDLTAAFVGDESASSIAGADVLGAFCRDILITAKPSEGLWEVPRNFRVSDLTISCRFKGDYFDRTFTLEGMPIEWMTEAYKGAEFSTRIGETIDKCKPDSIKEFFELFAPGKTLDWANIMHKSDTAISLGYVRFRSELAARTC